METGSDELAILRYATVCLHPSVSLNNDKICREFSEHKIAVCEKTAGLRSGNSSDLNSACLKVLVPVEIFQFSDMHYETERYRDSTDGLIFLCKVLYSVVVHVIFSSTDNTISNSKGKPTITRNNKNNTLLTFYFFTVHNHTYNTQISLINYEYITVEYKQPSSVNFQCVLRR